MPGPVTGAIAIAKIAGTAAQTISDAIGFDQVLQGESSSVHPLGGEATDAETENQFIDSIQQSLSQMGVSLNLPLSLRVKSGGRIEVASGHSQAASIEAALADAPELKKLAQNLLSSSNTPQRNIEVPAQPT